MESLPPGPASSRRAPSSALVWLQIGLVVFGAISMGLVGLPSTSDARLAAAFAAIFVVTALSVVGVGLAARVRHGQDQGEKAHRKEQEEIEELHRRARQYDAVAEISELIVRAPTLEALHHAVTQHLSGLVPDQDVAIYELRRGGIRLCDHTGHFAWPDQLDDAVLAEIEADHVQDIGSSAVIRLDSSASGLGLPPGRATLVPIALDGRPVGAIATVAVPGSAPHSPTTLLRTVANLIAAGHDRQSKDSALRQAQKMEAVGQLAGGVAHDFNNLLTAILGSTALAREQLDDPASVDRLLGDVERAGEHAAMLTRQMLAFSRHQPKRPAEVCVHEVIEGLESMVRRLLPENIRLELRLAAARGHVLADRHAIEQLVWNLVLNARDAITERGTITLGVAIDPAPGEHGELQLTVSDDGSGMDADTVERIFEPFFTTKELGQGTGLGLATVRRVVRDANGEISVDSRPGAGTRFTVRLPLSRPVTAPSVGVVDGRRRAPLPRGQAGACVLLVEDHELVRSSMRELLQSAGYKVVALPDGRAALEELSRRDDISAVISDVVMPRVCGDELLRIMRSRGDDTPVMLLTGYADERLRDTDPALLEGVPLLDKPVRSDELLRTLARLISARDGSANRHPASPSVGGKEPQSSAGMKIEALRRSSSTRSG